jgi:very-short-patch-repair endonuclease
LRRITFIPTTLGRLFGAEEINDLWCGTQDEERLWRAFKERGLAPERRYPLAEGEEERTADFALFCNKGRVAICVDTEALRNVKVVREHPLIGEYEARALGWMMLRLETRDVLEPAAACLRTIMEAADGLGGVAALPSGEGT